MINWPLVENFRLTTSLPLFTANVLQLQIYKHPRFCLPTRSVSKNRAEPMFSPSAGCQYRLFGQSQATCSSLAKCVTFVLVTARKVKFFTLSHPSARSVGRWSLHETFASFWFLRFVCDTETWRRRHIGNWSKMRLLWPLALAALLVLARAKREIPVGEFGRDCLSEKSTGNRFNWWKID